MIPIGDIPVLATHARYTLPVFLRASAPVAKRSLSRVRRAVRMPKAPARLSMTDARHPVATAGRVRKITLRRGRAA